ncbi:MAG: hypothetical protein YK1309IOTA_450004 [Marine Group I thaumarchaeote]|nr:MAG: hypothetical protein YK1309IOTA_450004 [Marine Group I thaumarchaeote]
MSSVLVNQVQQVPDRFYNASGKIRLVKVRDEFSREIISDYELTEIYKAWRDQKEYVVYREWKNGSLGHPKAFKCSKRGNDVYNWRIKQRFDEIDSLAEFYGDQRIFNVNESNPMTNCLFVTFTYDTKISGKELAWNEISKEYNNAITALRRKFGKISVLRVWESSKKGYPHVHAILLFEKKRFNVFEHWNKGATISTFRIQEKAQFGKVWHSNVDVLAVNSVKGILKYVSKYLRKLHSTNSKHEATLANMWIHRKQSFAISGKFVQELKSLRLDSSDLRNSNRKPMQTTIEGKKIKKKCVLVGVFSLDEIRRNNDVPNPRLWMLDLKKVPDRTTLPDEDRYVARQLHNANTGVDTKFSSHAFHCVNFNSRIGP